jgi:LacI family transcriptional regulator
VRIPQDLSLVGVDNSALAREADPPLTSVDVPEEEIGRESLRVLLGLMRGVPVEDCRVPMPVTQIVIRESTLAPKGEPHRTS